MLEILYIYSGVPRVELYLLYFKHFTAGISQPLGNSETRFKRFADNLRIYLEIGCTQDAVRL